MSILTLISDTLVSPAAAGNIEYNGQFYGTDSNAARGQLQRITQGTAVASTSGTSIDFTGIPAWAKRITLMVNGLSTNSSGNILIQLGTGSTSYTTSGYLGAATFASSAVTTTAYTTGFGITNATATTAFVIQGNVVITNLSGNIWTASGVFGESDAARTIFTGGGVTLSAALTAVRLYIDGTQQFDAGSVNILYEG